MSYDFSATSSSDSGIKSYSSPYATEHKRLGEGEEFRVSTESSDSSKIEKITQGAFSCESSVFFPLKGFEKELYKRNRWEERDHTSQINQILSLKDPIDKSILIEEILGGFSEWQERISFLMQLICEEMQKEASSAFLDGCKDKICEYLERILHDYRFLKQLSPTSFVGFILLIFYQAKICISDRIQRECVNLLSNYLDNCPTLKISYTLKNFESFFLMMCQYNIKEIAQKCFRLVFLSVFSSATEMSDYVDSQCKLWKGGTEFSPEKQSVDWVLQNRAKEEWDFHFDSFFAFFAKSPSDFFSIDLNEVERTIADVCLKSLFPNVSSHRLRELQHSNPVVAMLASHPSEEMKAISDSLGMQLWSDENLSYSTAFNAFRNAPSLSNESEWDKYYRLLKKFLHFAEGYKKEALGVSFAQSIGFSLLRNLLLENSCLRIMTDSRPAPLILSLERIKQAYDMALIYYYPPTIQLTLKYFNHYLSLLHRLPEYKTCLKALKLSCQMGDLPTQRKALQIFFQKDQWHQRLLEKIKQWKLGNVEQQESTSRKKYPLLINRINLGELTKLDEKTLRTISQIFPYSGVRLSDMTLSAVNAEQLLAGITEAQKAYCPEEQTTMDLLNYRILSEKQEIQSALRALSFHRLAFESDFLQCLTYLLQDKIVTITSLEITQSQLSEAELQSIGHMLVENRSLRVLNLSGNLFQPLAVVSLAEGVLKARLQTLKLRACGLNQWNVRLLLEAFSHHAVPTLECLDVGDNQIGESGKLFWKLFKAHRTLRVLHLDNNDISHDAAMTLIEKTRRVVFQESVLKINLENNSAIHFSQIPHCHLFSAFDRAALAVEILKVEESVKYPFRKSKELVGMIPPPSPQVILYGGIAILTTALFYFTKDLEGAAKYAEYCDYL